MFMLMIILKNVMRLTMFAGLVQNGWYAYAEIVTNKVILDLNGEDYEMSKNEWISVKDKLPDPYVSVLVYMPESEEFPPVREGFIANGSFYVPVLFDTPVVTYWMEMPDPPSSMN